MRDSFKFPLLLIVPVLIMGNSHALLSLEQKISNFEWKKRLVFVIAKDKNINLIRGVESFFKEKSCQNENRKLELYKIIGNEITKYKIPSRYEGRTGIWLIGLAGSEKAYSNDLSVLDQLYEIIDEMPIRKNEMLQQNSRCD